MGNTNICYIDTDMVGVLQVSGTAGALLAFLHQALVTGTTPVTLTSLMRAGDVATATLNNHGLTDIVSGFGPMLTLAGANQSEYNGPKRITVLSPNQFTFPVIGAPATPATGTITAQLTPLGWTREYNGTNKAIYKGDDMSDGLLWRFDDNAAALPNLAARGCAVRAAEAATDVDTLIRPMPLAPTTNNQMLLVKSDAASAAARKAFVCGDGQGFLLGIQVSNSYSYDLAYIGDCVSETPGDLFRGIFIGPYADNSSYSFPYFGNSFLQNQGLNSTTQGKHKIRGYAQDEGAIPLGTVLNSSIHSTMGSAGMAAKNAANNGRHYARVRLTDGVRLIGILPGLLDIWHNTSSLLHKAPLGPIPGLEGRTFMFVKTTATGSESGVALDLTGPWR